jgi:hypothetical protein
MPAHYNPYYSLFAHRDGVSNAANTKMKRRNKDRLWRGKYAGRKITTDGHIVRYPRLCNGGESATSQNIPEPE